MYLMYVDESGDPGLVGSPTRFFALTGIVLHELKWHQFMADLKAIRVALKAKYGLGVRDEIHASEFINKSHPNGYPFNIRLQIFRDYIRALSNINYISITNICVDKQGKPADYDVFTHAWQHLFQRFDTTLLYKNFPGPANAQDNGIVFCDDTNGKSLQRLMRKMSVYNPIPYLGGSGYRNLPIRMVVEDPNMRDSKDSLPIQAADACAYMLYQHLAPNARIKKKTGRGYFKHLLPILNLKAAPRHPEGILIL